MYFSYSNNYAPTTSNYKLDDKMIGTPNQKHCLRTRMIIDDGGYPKLLRNWALTYVFGFNLYELLVKVY
jgi:hypothetical protein